MAVQPAVAKEWRERTGGPILQGYGLTETSPVAIVCRIGSEFTGSIGLPITVDQRHASATMMAKQLGINEVGEICIKGPQVMEGYWQRPAGNSEGHAARRLAAHRRHRAHGRERLRVHRRPQEGHDPGVRIQRLSERDRKHRGRDGRHPRGRRDRHPGRALGRNRQGLSRCARTTASRSRTYSITAAKT